MNNISISRLKVNSSQIINQALDHPITVKKRNKIQAYMIGKELYKKIIASLEDYIDKLAIKSTNFSRCKDFEKVVRKLGIGQTIV